jgi:hypothetical protein
MKRPIPSHDPRAAHCRKVLAARRIGKNAKCACGEDRPEALRREKGLIICARCVRNSLGHKQFDGHHLFGSANSDVRMLIPVNDHCADLNVAQYAWPPKTLQNPDGSPLLARAAFIRGFADINSYLVREFLLSSAEMLELHDTELENKWGKKWWKHTKVKKFEPKT